MIASTLSAILGTALLYLLLCFVAIGINEWISGARGSRGQFLKEGIKRLLPDPPIFRRAMRHPLISGMYRDRAMLGNPPSYVNPTNFASAVLDVVWTRARVAGCVPASTNRLDGLRLALKTLERDHPLVAAAIASATDRAQTYEEAVAAIEAWYSSAMERVAGWYSRFTRRRIFVIALVISATANIDAVHVARTFWRVEPAAAVAPWPIGYSCLAETADDDRPATSGCSRRVLTEVSSAAGIEDLLGRVLGWLVTAVAVALGAPYLFQLLRIKRAG
jgi:hypothetical protein